MDIPKNNTVRHTAIDVFVKDLRKLLRRSGGEVRKVVVSRYIYQLLKKRCDKHLPEKSAKGEIVFNRGETVIECEP